MICTTLRECFLVDFSKEETSPTIRIILSQCFTESRVLAIVLFRLSQYFWRKRFLWRLGPVLKRLNEILTGFECHLSAQVDSGLFLAHTQNIVIGEGVSLEKNVTLYNGVTLGSRKRTSVTSGLQRYPIIKNGVVIYSGAKIIGPITLGRNAVVGANAVVIADVPENYVAVGVPAKNIPPDQGKHELFEA